ncbi:MAG: sigma-70 family RNA polymerase sigma factor [Bacillota bacterium]|nr:sigma-70 family RNA polymerase sigma factor [Bacillota bacterium]
MASKYVPVAKEDTYKLIEAAQKGDARARELIVDQNIGLVKNLAMKYTSNYYEPEDLMQVGFVGLVKAIDRFDCRYDVMFSTYAVPMILGEIKRFIRDDGKIKISRQLKTEMKNLKNIQQEYYNKHGKSPKISFLAKALDTSSEHVMEILEAIDSLSNVESLDNTLIPEGMHGGYYVDEETQNVNLMDLKAAISDLEDRERQIIMLRYFKDMTQQQIAKVMGISQVQVSRIEKKVLIRMREQMEKAE